MISLFEKTATDFSGHGMMVLDPVTCTVAEVAGGSYTLHMEHPMDAEGKYLELIEERIIKAPVPPTWIPEITLPSVTVWQTTAATNLYSVLPAYRRTSGNAKIKAVRQNPSAYAWKSYVFYTAGSYVTQSGRIYYANYGNQGYLPGGAAAGDRWTDVGAVNGETDTWQQDGGTVIELLASGVQVTKIADYNGEYMQVRAASGNVGYILRSSCAETETQECGMVIRGQEIREQAFRIYKVSGEDDTQTITVEARHISYDFQGNGLFSCEVADADPMTAISRIRGALLDSDDRQILCNISGKTISKDWSFKNPINALLDPEDGMVAALGAQLIRNNRDFYILSNESPRKGITIAYGRNMTGVSWSRNIENVITRVAPRCGDGNGGWLYIDSVYVESAHSMSYRVQRTEMMNCGYDVGDEYEKADGSRITLTTESAKAQMQQDAQDRFDVDNVDAAEVSLDVEFVLLGDTEEYAQYRGLERVCLYDMITVKMDRSGLEATAQVTEYEYDSIRRRYNSIRIGDIKSMSRRIPGYRLKKGSITYDKLGNSVISKIKSATA